MYTTISTYPLLLVVIHVRFEKTMKCIQTTGKKAVLSERAPNHDPTDVVLDIAYSGLCRTDVLVGSGVIPVAKGLVLGHECSGVVKFAPKDSLFSKGDRVVVNPVLEKGFLGVDRDGSFAEEMSISERNLISIPKNLDLKTAAYTEPVAAALIYLIPVFTRRKEGLS